VPTAKRTTRKKSIIIAGAHEPLSPWAEGVDHLRQLDPKWRAIIDEVGPCKLVLRPDRFGTLVRAIIGQQISSRPPHRSTGESARPPASPTIPRPSSRPVSPACEPADSRG
jgi:hypothetical protein